MLVTLESLKTTLGMSRSLDPLPSTMTGSSSLVEESTVENSTVLRSRLARPPSGEAGAAAGGGFSFMVDLGLGAEAGGASSVSAVGKVGR